MWYFIMKSIRNFPSIPVKIELANFMNYFILTFGVPCPYNPSVVTSISSQPLMILINLLGTFYENQNLKSQILCKGLSLWLKTNTIVGSKLLGQIMVLNSKCRISMNPKGLNIKQVMSKLPNKMGGWKENIDIS